MKQTITIEQWNDLPQGVQNFITNWKDKKGYSQESPLLTIGETIELLIAVTHNFHKEEFLHGTFNNVLELDEVQIGWDGEHLIDILLYSVVGSIKTRMSRSTHELTP